MSTLDEVIARLRGAVAAPSRTQDPLQVALARKSLGTAAYLAVFVVAFLFLVNLLFTRVIWAPKAANYDADSVLRAASKSIDEVVLFANSSSTENLTEEITPEETYPQAVVVEPLTYGSNPFGTFAVAAAPSSDLGALIRSKQAQVKAEPEPEPALPSIRGIVARGTTSMAILASGGTSKVVRPGDAFGDWKVLAVGRDQVRLVHDGKTRTIVWEGSK